MKKITAGIFTVLLGVITSGAANADIASKDYVDAQNTAQDANVTQVVGDAIDEAVANINGNLTDMATKTWVGDQDYATNTALTTGLGTKADAAATATALGAKANQATTYTKTEVDGLITAGEYDDTALAGRVTAAETAITTKANQATTYTKTEVDGLITAGEYDDTALAGRVTANETAITGLGTNKADKSTTYTKTEVDTALGAKANQATTYTKTEVDGLITTSEYDDTALAGRVTANETAITGLGTTKANASDVNAALALKTTDSTLGILAKAAPATCANPSSKCVLTYNGTAFAWEDVTR